MLYHHASLFFSLLVAVATTKNAVEGLDVVLMGDSYSSGMGARAEDGSENYYGPSGCTRSPTTWGAQYAEAIGATSFTNVACSGGFIRQITNPRFMGKFPKFPWQSCPMETDSDDEYWDTYAWNCHRMLKPQYDAITSETDLVIMTISGNDAKIITLLSHCFTLLGNPSTCEWYLNQGVRDQFPQIEEDLRLMLDALQTKLNYRAKVVFVNYPLFVQDMGYTINNISPNVDQQVRTIAEDLNQIMIDVAADYDFVEVYTHSPIDFDGHEFHPNPWFNNPDRWITEWNAEGLEGFHVNVDGHEGWAAAIVQQEGTFGL